ncbi:hypothetical protein K502DRAFT_324851 [Neoconidiobolus thromboides FSU 785]|nr:hypothetical protein K502DRAFT_324851 [Neoconidiobolus thromboides FSU 785]
MNPVTTSIKHIQTEQLLKRKAQLITEFFEFVPLHFVDEVINSVNDKMYLCLSKFENILYDTMLNPKDIEESMNQIDTLLEGAVDTTFDVFELYCIDTVFNFTKDEPISLLHYNGLDFNLTAEDEENLIKEIEEEKKKLVEAKLKNIKLKIIQHHIDQYVTLVTYYASAVNQIYLEFSKNSDSPISELIQTIITEFLIIKAEHQKTSKLLRLNYENLPTLRDLYLQKTLISTLTETLPMYKQNPFSNFSIELEFNNINKGKDWKRIHQVLGLSKEDKN